MRELLLIYVNQMSYILLNIQCQEIHWGTEAGKGKGQKETDKEEDKKSDANAVREATKVKKWLNVRLFIESYIEW